MSRMRVLGVSYVSLWGLEFLCKVNVVAVFGFGNGSAPGLFEAWVELRSLTDWSWPDFPFYAPCFGCVVELLGISLGFVGSTRYSLCVVCMGSRFSMYVPPSFMITGSYHRQRKTPSSGPLIVSLDSLAVIDCAWFISFLCWPSSYYDYTTDARLRCSPTPTASAVKVQNDCAATHKQHITHRDAGLGSLCCLVTMHCSTQHSTAYVCQ